MKFQKLSIIALATSSACVLSGCTSAEQTEPAQEPQANTSVAQLDATEAPTTESATEKENPSGSGLSFSAVDAVMVYSPKGVVTSVDREIGTDKVEVFTVVGEEYVQYMVNPDLKVEEGSRGLDQDAAALAGVNVGIKDAMNQALLEHPGAVVDAAWLEGDNWMVVLDDFERNHIADLEIPAKV